MCEGRGVWGILATSAQLYCESKLLYQRKPNKKDDAYFYGTKHKIKTKKRKIDKFYNIQIKFYVSKHIIIQMRR